MIIESVIIDEPTTASYLRKCLSSHFPEIHVRGQVSDYLEACELIRKIRPHLVFSDVTVFERGALPLTSTIGSIECDVIYTSHRLEDALQALRQDVCGFILKPLNINDIVLTVKSALGKLSKRSYSRVDVRSQQEGLALPHTKLIGIPTVEGIEFLPAYEIIRCEGLQKCTRIISTRKANLISAYNIGEFRKLLEPSGFFSCHKSHLINLMHVRRFTREGFVFLLDNIAVPLARRKRIDFLQQLPHL